MFRSPVSHNKHKLLFSLNIFLRFREFPLPFNVNISNFIMKRSVINGSNDILVFLFEFMLFLTF